MKKVNALLGLFVAGALLWSCSSESNVYKMGTLEGRVFNADGSRTLGAIKVQIDLNGDVFLTTTDANGNFTLDAPVGTHDLVMGKFGDIAARQRNSDRLTSHSYFEK